MKVSIKKVKPYQLWFGDCLELMKDIPDGSIDLILCDPPYGTTSCKWDSIIPLEPMWKELKRIIKPNGMVCIMASSPFNYILGCSNLKMFRHEWIWNKSIGSNFANTVREPFKEHESVLCFSYGKWTYNKQMQERMQSGKRGIGTPLKYNSKPRPTYRDFTAQERGLKPELRVPSSVQRFNVERGLHPTQKPVALMQYLVKTYSNPNELVLDFVMGSGTVGVACRNLKRRFIGIEKDQTYFQIAKKRLEDKNSK